MNSSTSWLHENRWTLGLCILVLLLNLGLFPAMPACTRQLIAELQFDRQAILHGQAWRLITGNLVHWSPKHLALDLAAFLIIGLLCERYCQRTYPWLLLATALAVGSALLVFQPEMVLYRGLSGVDSGQFAAALVIELIQARGQSRRWFFLVPAIVVFVLKLGYECASGRLFFGTESLGDMGFPVPLAHAVGAAAGGLLALRGLGRRFRVGKKSNPDFSRRIGWVSPKNDKKATDCC